MEAWLIWIAAGLVLTLLEIVLPGGIVVFLGFSAMLVGATLYWGIVDSVMMAFTTWFIASIFSLLFLRSFFVKYFEGDSIVQNVNEDRDIEGCLAEVVETIQPYKEGRVRFRDTTWEARSEETIAPGTKIRIIRLEGNCLIVQSL